MTAFKPYQRLRQAPRLLKEAQEREAVLRIKSRQRSAKGRSIRVAPANVLLKKSENEWAFASERALEDFVYDNLLHVLGLTSLARQRSMSGEICDILALDHNRQLVVLELKNVEDRSLIQQLTRYYHALQEEKPFQDQVDYRQPIRLVAIAPSFHKHNWIDRQYNQLSFEFWQFAIIQEAAKLYLQLQNLDTQHVHRVEIPYTEQNTFDIAKHLPDPPTALHNILKSCPADKRQHILDIRQKTLCFDERIQEIIATNVVKYGRGSSNFCAEIRAGGQWDPVTLWFYLPIPYQKRVKRSNTERQEFIQPTGRMQIASTDCWRSLFQAAHIPNGKRSAKECYKFSAFQELVGEEKVLEPALAIDTLLGLALNTWLSKLR